MDLGYVEATTNAYLSWPPHKVKSQFKHALGFESEPFGKGDGHGAKANAHKCNECQKIIIDLAEDFNKLIK